MPATTNYEPLSTTAILLLAAMVSACTTAELTGTLDLPLSGPAGSDRQIVAPTTASQRPPLPDTHVESALPENPDTHVVSSILVNPDTHIHTSEIDPDLTVVGPHVTQNRAASFRTNTRPAVSVLCTASDAAMRTSMLSLISTARASTRSCGNVNFAATNSLSWSDALQRSARVHSTDMATDNFFGHVGNDGRSVSDRVTDEHYSWQITGENIAAGQRDTAEVLAGWLASPGHCANIMNPRYTTLAVACSSSRSADFGRYWTAVFAAPL